MKKFCLHFYVAVGSILAETVCSAATVQGSTREFSTRAGFFSSLLPSLTHTKSLGNTGTGFHPSSLGFLKLITTSLLLQTHSSLLLDVVRSILPHPRSLSLRLQF
jgi:hypothetical protein